MIEDFLHLPPVSLTPVANLELRISPRIFEKISKQPLWYTQGLGEKLFMKKTRSRKSRDTVPLSHNYGSAESDPDSGAEIKIYGSATLRVP